MKIYLEDNYDLRCYNSIFFKDDNKVKLVALMGYSLMIVMFQNNEIQNQEINTAKVLNIPILIIYNSEEDRNNNEVNQIYNTILIQNLEVLIETILINRYKFVKKERKNLPFKTLKH
jgi:hypothetical protein